MPITNRLPSLLIYACFLSLQACVRHPASVDLQKGSFGFDRKFLQDHVKNLTVLSNAEGASVLVCADYQGRVMTSSARGDTGRSYGWINYALIRSGKWNSQFNPVGGEERFWMGPEGGQYSLYFHRGDSFTIRHWQVPAVIDTESYEVAGRNDTAVSFVKKATLVNYAGTPFHIAIARSVTLLRETELARLFGTRMPDDVNAVAYRTSTVLRNEGPERWSKERGLISVWLLGMMTPSPATKVMLPFHGAGNVSSFITDDYFGKIPADRLKVNDSVVYLRCDGKFRGKVGLSPRIARPVVGSMDFDHNVLTLIAFPVDSLADYVNSKWEQQREPYKGDAVNAYNDGPLTDGSQLGPFYEIESSSPAKELIPGGTLEYHQVTCHIQGAYNSLKQLAMQLLGTDLDDLKKW